MKKSIVLVLVLLVILVPAAFAAIPRFADPVLMEDSGVVIDVDYYAAPMMYDWNRDGKKDMVVGQFTSGKIRFYPNVGDDSAPVFNGYEFMRASGAEIVLPAG